MQIDVDFSRKDRKKIKEILLSSIRLVKWIYWSEKYNFRKISNHRISNSHLYTSVLTNTSNSENVLPHIPKWVDFNFYVFTQRCGLYRKYVKDLNFSKQMFFGDEDFFTINIIRPYRLCGELFNFWKNNYFWYLQNWNFGFSTTTTGSYCFYTDLGLVILDQNNMTYGVRFQSDIFESNRLRIQLYIDYCYDYTRNLSIIGSGVNTLRNSSDNIYHSPISNDGLLDIKQKIQKQLQTNFINILQRYMLWFLIK